VPVPGGRRLPFLRLPGTNYLAPSLFPTIVARRHGAPACLRLRISLLRRRVPPDLPLEGDAALTCFVTMDVVAALRDVATGRWTDKYGKRRIRRQLLCSPLPLRTASLLPSSAFSCACRGSCCSLQPVGCIAGLALACCFVRILALHLGAACYIVPYILYNNFISIVYQLRCGSTWRSNTVGGCIWDVLPFRSMTYWALFVYRHTPSHCAL